MYFNIEFYSDDDLLHLPLSFATGPANDLEEAFSLLFDTYKIAEIQLNKRGLKK